MYYRLDYMIMSALLLSAADDDDDVCLYIYICHLGAKSRKAVAAAAITALSYFSTAAVLQQ